MRGLRALAWLACLGASAGQFMTIPPHKAAKRDAVNAKKTARNSDVDARKSMAHGPGAARHLQTTSSTAADVGDKATLDAWNGKSVTWGERFASVLRGDFLESVSDADSLAAALSGSKVGDSVVGDRRRRLQDGVTTERTGEGRCTSDLNENSPSETTDSAEACWKDCLEAYGDDLVAIDWHPKDDDKCFCQDDCRCMKDADGSKHVVITRDEDIEDLPDPCPDYSNGLLLDDGTRKWTGRGWCSSDLDASPSASIAPTSAETCWSACKEVYKNSLVAIDWSPDEKDCFCQDKCRCMENVDGSYEVITSESLGATLPEVCSDDDDAYYYFQDDLLQDGTSRWTGRGWCLSDLDEFPSSGATTDSPEACWTECLAEYKDDLVAIDWDPDEKECFCQDDCKCMGSSDNVVITRDSKVGAELPEKCVSNGDLFEDGTRRMWFDRGWCFSDLDELSPSEKTKNAPDCWDDCQGKFGERLVAIDWSPDDEECFCQDACRCMDGVDKRYEVITRESKVGAELPPVCGADEECEDDLRFKDSDGDDCTWYATDASDDDDCGKYDTDDFKANEQCCACGGSKTSADTCKDGDALDSFGDGCSYYVRFPEDCGEYDHDDFTANEECCACDGGTPTTGPNPTPPPSAFKCRNFASISTATSINIFESDPDRKSSSDTQIVVDKEAGKDEDEGKAIGLLKFDLSQHADADCKIVRATLRLYTLDSSDDDIKAYRISKGSWDDESTWNSINSDSGVKYEDKRSFIIESPDEDFYEYVDVTEDVQFWLEKRGENEGWWLRNSGTNGWTFASKHHANAAFRPALRLFGEFGESKTWATADRSFLLAPPGVGYYCGLNSTEGCWGAPRTFVEESAACKPMCSDGNAATCCDSDGNCDDGTDAYCCGFNYLCSNNGEPAEWQGELCCSPDAATSGNFATIPYGGLGDLYDQDAAPAIADLNGDGLPDLVLGLFGRGFRYFQQQRIGGDAKFVLVEPIGCGEPGVSFERVKAGQCPEYDEFLDCETARCGEFCDTNGECGLDFLNNCEIIDDDDGTSTSTLDLYKKICSDPYPFPSYFPRSKDLGRGFAVRNLIPAFADLDGDGDYDLVLGNKDGYLQLFENTGSKTEPMFELVGTPPGCGGDGVKLVEATECPNDTNLDPCDEVGCGELCEGDGECGTDDDLNNCGSRDIYFKSCTGPFYSNPFWGMNFGKDSAPAFADIDGDGDLDLVVGKQNGALDFYRNIGDEFKPKFELDAESVFAKITVGEESIPTLGDVDRDGDVDLILGYRVGQREGKVRLYRNIGSKTEPAFALDSSDPFGAVSFRKQVYPALGDVDGDGWLDLAVGTMLDGVKFYHNIPTLVLERVVGKADPFTNIQADGEVVAAFGDLDGDGLADLVVAGPNSDRALFYYKNTGIQGAPRYESEEGSPIEGINHQIRKEGGDEYFAVALGDVDGDEKLDLVLGSEEDLVLYLNDGTPEAPKFERRSSLAGLIEQLISKEHVPTLADLNGDGRLDLILGTRGGDLQFYPNMGGSKMFRSSEENPFSAINDKISSNSAPALADVDEDGLLDLVVGDQSKTRFYRNVGTRTQPKFADDFGDKILGGNLLGSEIAPTFWDVDGDDKAELIIGDNSGHLNLFYVGGYCAARSRDGECSTKGRCDALSVGHKNATCQCGGGFGGSQCEECLPGFFGLSCQPCKPNYYWRGGVPREGETCNICEAGKYSPQGSGDCTVCPAGQYSREGEGCKDCDAGNYSANNGTAICEQCSEGKYSEPGQSKCTPCAVGFYAAKSGASECDACSKGKFTNTTGSSTCKSCQDGYHQDGLGEPQCVVCAPNQIPSKDSEKCGDCKAGWYSKPGDKECKRCEAGRYRNEIGDDGQPMNDCGQCINQGSNKWSEPGSADCTLCEKGYYRDGDGKDACKKCKHGMKCDDIDDATHHVTLKNVELKAQYWRRTDSSSEIEKCPVDNSCESNIKKETDSRRRLADGTPAPTTASAVDAGEALCKDGHRGPLCAVCRNHYYRSGLECKECTSGAQALNIALPIIVFLVFLVAVTMSLINLDMGILMWFKKKGKELEDDVHEKSAGELLDDEVDKKTDEMEEEGGAALGRNFKTVVKQMLGMWSVVSSTPWILQVQYPRTFDRVLAWLNNFFSFELTISVDCATDHINFKQKLLIDTLGPFILCVIVGVIGWLIHSYGSKIPSWLVFKDANKDKKKDNAPNSSNALSLAAEIILFILFLSYTATSTTIFQGLRPCHKLDGEYNGSNKYMYDDYDVSCHSKRYEFIYIWSWLMLFVYPIGIPLATFSFMWQHRDKLNPDISAPKREESAASSEGADVVSREPAVVDKKTSRKDKARAAVEKSDDAIAGMEFLKNLGKPPNPRLPNAEDVLDCASNMCESKLDVVCQKLSTTRSYNALTGNSDDVLRLEFVRKGVVSKKLAERKRLIQEDKNDESRAILERPELFKFMYDNYEPDYWWFECFDYIRRLLLTGMLVILNDGSAAQGLFGVLVALGATQVYGWTRPFVHDASDRLAQSAQWSTFFIFLAALMILLDVSAESPFQQKVFAALLVLLNFLPLGVGTLVAILNARDKASKKKELGEGDECRAIIDRDNEDLDEKQKEAAAGDSEDEEAAPEDDGYDV